MKKRLLAMGLSLLLVLTMLPTVWALPDDTAMDETTGATENVEETDGHEDAEQAGEVAYIIDGNMSGEYASLADAMKAAQNSVQLLADETVDQITVTKTLTLDLNGHTLTKAVFSQPVFRVGAVGSTSAHLTIQDSSGDKSGAVVGLSSETDSTGGASIITVVDGGELTVEGGTIRDNTISNQGGGIFATRKATVNICGGTISNNTAAEGGGIYATQNSTVNIKGGEISHNTATSTVMDRNGITPQGGGGIAIVGTVTLNMSGGEISNNTAEGAGGGIGIRRVKGTDAPVFTMTGGVITKNTAKAHEGGGIRLEGTGTITPTEGRIEITENICNTESDLGGGGIFVASDSTATIYNAIIKDNSAGGLGGGLASCIHGDLSVLSTDGAAIYDNQADGENFTTGTGRADRRDTLKKALGKHVVSVDDAQDFFSAGDIAGGTSEKGESVVGDRMPGGGSHRWTGVDGGKKISIGLGSAHYSHDYLVLTAHPTAADIAKLDSISGNIVDISGNKAHNHGGGVATNGVLLFGSQEDSYNVVADAQLDVVKKLKQVNTATGTTTDLQTGLDGYTFELVNKDGHVITEATTGADGKACLEIPADQFDSAKPVYTFTLRERKGNDTDIEYDKTEYTVKVTLTKGSSETISIGTQSITIYNYDSDVVVTDADADTPESESTPVFTNTVKHTPTEARIQISGEKQVSTGAPDTQFTFQLLDENETLIDTATVTGGGTFTFDSLTYDTVGEHTYTVREAHGNQDGWTYDGTVYTVTVDVTTDANGDLTASVTYSIGGAPCGKIVFTNSYTPPDTPPDNPPDDEDEPSTVNVRVKKEWILDDGGTRPESITVALLRNGKVHERVTLSEDNNWTHSWTGLDSSYR